MCLINRRFSILEKVYAIPFKISDLFQIITNNYCIIMYNEKIEMLINAALADGVLTEKEKQILFKRAQEQGIDLDEFEMVLDARLVELQKAEKERAATSAPKSTKFGDVRKCPVCGALVPALAVSCAECGYEFTGINASSSSQTLSKQISEIQERANKQKAGISTSGKYSTERSSALDPLSPLEKALNAIDDAAEEEIESLVNNFPVPNAKNDLFDMILFLKSHKYNDKYKECIERARHLYPDDSLFIKIREEAKADKKKEAIKVILAVLVLSLFAIVGKLLDSWGVLDFLGI